MTELYQRYQDLSAFNGIPFELDIILRILAAAIAGAIVGYERKRRQKEAGVRTHCMVAIGAAIFAIVSKYGFFDSVVFNSVQVDASRVSANIVTGVCFLGAGMIFVKNKFISGLTTAAGIWAVSAIGLAFGTGMYNLGIVSTLLIIIIQYILHKPLVKLEGSANREITCILDSFEDIERFQKVLVDIDPGVYFTSIEKRNDGSVLVKFIVRVGHGNIIDNIYLFMKDYPYVKSIIN